jgi:threonine dehydrogenase-like Zn-dependent dehydrogenase
MRAGVFAGPGMIRIDEVPVPRPGPGEVRLRVQGCGICGSDLPVWEGRPWLEYPRAPGAPGHETWGVVDAVGPEVSGIAEGERVAALSYNGYAQFDIARADQVLRLPDAVSADEPFPGEPLGCAVNAFRRAGIGAGDVVAVIGVGFLGAVIVQLAAHAGARVIGVARRREARDLAQAMGAGDAVDLASAPRVVGELSEGRLCDVVVEATGAQAPLDLAGELTRIRGRLVIAGYHQGGRRTIDLQLWNWRGLDVINAHERDPHTYLDGMRLAAEAVASGRLDPRRLYTGRFSLDELDDAFAVARDGAPGKALVCP